MKYFTAIGLLLALPACTAMQPFGIVGSDPSSPEHSIHTVGYSPVTAGHNSRRPVEPAPWGEMNRRVAPGS
jgi:hypothetical protein